MGSFLVPGGRRLAPRASRRSATGAGSPDLSASPKTLPAPRPGTGRKSFKVDAAIRIMDVVGAGMGRGHGNQRLNRPEGAFGGETEERKRGSAQRRGARPAPRAGENGEPDVLGGHVAPRAAHHRYAALSRGQPAARRRVGSSWPRVNSSGPLEAGQCGRSATVAYLSASNSMLKRRLTWTCRARRRRWPVRPSPDM